MPPSDGRVACHAGTSPLSGTAEFPSANENDIRNALDGVSRDVLEHVVDVHCHPTDSDMAMTLAVVQDIPMRLCAMATRQSDQRLVADLARAHPDKVIPCFGWYPARMHLNVIDCSHIATVVSTCHSALLDEAPASLCSDQSNSTC